MIEFFVLCEKDIWFLCDLLNEEPIISALHIEAMDYDNLLESFHRYWKNDEDEKHFVINSGGKPVGWLKLNGLCGAECVWISVLAVSGGEQGKGIGKRAVAFAEEYAKSKGFHAVCIQTDEDNAAARALYEKSGYISSGNGMRVSGDGALRARLVFRKEI